jgi:hypothetical protein
LALVEQVRVRVKQMAGAAQTLYSQGLLPQSAAAAAAAMPKVGLQAAPVAAQVRLQVFN